MSEQSCPAHRGTFSDDHSIRLTFPGNREFALAPVTRSITSGLNPLFQNLSFDPEEVAVVNHAYDLACQTLQNIGQLEVDREIIARRILQAAESGERNANKLCERAIHGLTAFDFRQHGA